MNRKARRDMMKQGGRDMMQSPCTITEAVQIARGAAEDVVDDFQKRTSPMHVAMSIQLELLKSMLMESGVISEEEFRDRYVERVEEFNRLRAQMTPVATEDAESEAPSMDMRVEDTEVVQK